MLVSAALRLDSPNGRSYGERIDAARTEKELNDAFQDFIGMVPLGQRLFGSYNPVRTGGPMQVGIAFAEQHAQARPYPYPIERSLRDEVFTRRGGLYFGIAHLLDYRTGYDRPIYRFADFNAGRWASRNAAFQAAVSAASGIPLELDGDLIRIDGDPDRPGATELAVRTIARRLDASEGAIRRTLEQGDQPDFERQPLVQRVYALAEQVEKRPLPRARIPRINLRQSQDHPPADDRMVRAARRRAPPALPGARRLIRPRHAPGSQPDRVDRPASVRSCRPTIGTALRLQPPVPPCQPPAPSPSPA